MKNMKNQLVFWLFYLCVIQVQAEDLPGESLSLCVGEPLELKMPLDLSTLVWTSYQWTQITYWPDGDVDTSDRIGSRLAEGNYVAINSHFEAAENDGIRTQVSLPNDTFVYKITVLATITQSKEYNVTVFVPPEYQNDGLLVNVELFPDNSVELTCGDIIERGYPPASLMWTLNTGKTIIVKTFDSNATILRLANNSGVTSGKCSLVPDNYAYTCISEDKLPGWSVDFEIVYPVEYVEPFKIDLPTLIGCLVALFIILLIYLLVVCCVIKKHRTVCCWQEGYFGLRKTESFQRWL